MEDTAPRRHAFVVRIWQEENLPWRGWVQHAGSHEAIYVQTLEALLSFIQGHTGELGSHRAEGERDQADH